MSSASQIAANQHNAQSSTGPKTEQGKAVVSQNAIKFCFTGRHLVLPTENQAEFDALHQAFVDEHQLTGPTAQTFVFDMAAARWKKRRIEARRTEVLATHGFDHPELKLLDRYERTAQTEFYRAFNSLLVLRRAQTQKELDNLRDKNESLHRTVNNGKALIERLLCPQLPIPGPGDIAKLLNETKPISSPAAAVRPPQRA